MPGLRKSFVPVFLVLAITASPTACASQTGVGKRAVPPTGSPLYGEWRATVEVPGGDLGFSLHFSGAPDRLVLRIGNGDERVVVQEIIEPDDGRYEFNLFSFDSSIEAKLEGGVLTGTLTLVKRGGVEQVMPFRAVRASGFVFSIDTKPAVDVNGRWAVTFTDDGGQTSQAIGEFVQDGASLQGTFLTPTGDYRYLAGSILDRELVLSCFDGAHAFLFKARADDDGRISGDFWSGTQWHETWTAVRDADAALPDPTTLTRLEPGARRFPFDFPDPGGRRLTSEDARFDGKVVIVTVAGSWCPNSHDEAAFMARFYERYRDRGFEAVGLMYEHHRDFDRAARQVERFRIRHDIQYPLLVAGYSDKTEAAATLAALPELKAFPTMIVIGRDGNVRRIHTGFTGPATGAHFDAFEAELTEFVEGLLGEE